jgi:hypothetical protein
MFHNAHGGGMWGGEGREGSFYFHVPRCFVAVPPVTKVAYPVVVIFPPTV